MICGHKYKTIIVDQCSTIDFGYGFLITVYQSIYYELYETVEKSPNNTKRCYVFHW